MMLKDKKVAIVGGGPGGLTLARLLQLKGADVVVYERDVNKNARVQGSPLDLHEKSGLAALTKANLLDVFKKNFMVGADKMIITNDQAHVNFSDHGNKPEENFESEHFRPEIDRGVLRKILLESLQPETLVWDSQFTSLEKKDEGWLLHFKNKSSVYADVVISAEGANSKIRPYITNIKPFYSGITMLEGNIYEAKKLAPNIHKLLSGGKIMAFGNNKNILLGQKANEEIGFYVSLKTPESWATNSGIDFLDRAQVMNWFKKEYAEWDSMWTELFESANTPFIPRPIYCMPFDQTWQSLPNLTMLGDAAHLMPPFAGEGVNMAMLDALELSECLTSENHSSLLDAISFYEANMRQRASLAAQESVENGERMHAENALQNMLDFFGGHTA
jgi:2-polyprenyl-6-methoxyphenol hydroxylase-like FAD-dependent oxidoreductase